MYPVPAKPAAERTPVPGKLAPGKTALAIDGVARRYGPVVAVDGVSLTVASGEIVALVGHSGSGKSTLLRLIAGLEQPSGGTIAIDGRSVSGVGRFVPPEERGVGMMFQDYALFPHLSVIDNVRFGLAGLSKAEAIDRARVALARIGLGQRGDAYPHALSGGEQQRVALIRALLPAPRILLMDEPFSNLDRRTRDRIRDDTTAIIRESGTTAILVTHDPEDAMRVADRVMLMEAGRIARGGTTEELYRQPGSLLVARFFGDFNEIEGVVADGRVATAVGSFAARGIGDGTPAVVCIRAHDLTLGGDVGGSIPSTIVGRAFVGDELVLSLAIAGLAHPLQIRVPATAGGAIGDRVALHLAATSDVLVFPAAAERAGPAASAG